jgi:hypothetical protein
MIVRNPEQYVAARWDGHIVSRSLCLTSKNKSMSQEWEKTENSSQFFGRCEFRTIAEQQETTNLYLEIQNNRKLVGHRKQQSSPEQLCLKSTSNIVGLK